jgi:membrane protease YdiL (CAAX protease family)
MAARFPLLNPWSYPVVVSYGPWAVLMLGLFAAHKRIVYPDLRFIGTISGREAMRWIAVMTVIYLALYATTLWFGQPREPFMRGLYMARTPVQNAILIGSLLVLPPIVEEIAFRHFLLSVLPFRAGRKTAAVAILATAAFFALQHHAYMYVSTYLLLFAVGVVLALARIRSDGMLLPIGLHSYSVVLALVGDHVMSRLQG